MHKKLKVHSKFVVWLSLKNQEIQCRGIDLTNPMSKNKTTRMPKWLVSHLIGISVSISMVPDFPPNVCTSFEIRIQCSSIYV